ncbi:MAG: GtrA family protein [Bacteroidales bacterium]|nr:GtrA family protein [Bacteroidales bacterium]
MRQLLRLGIRPQKMKEFMKFAMVGGSGVLVNMGCFFIFTRFVGMRIEFASPIAIELSILTNFFLNNAWTFRKRDTNVGFGGRIIRYHLVTAIAGGVNYLTLLVLANTFGLHDLLANLIGIILGTFINFFLNSSWTWRVSSPEDDLSGRKITSGQDFSPEKQD